MAPQGTTQSRCPKWFGLTLTQQPEWCLKAPPQSSVPQGHCPNTSSQLTLSNPYLLWHTSVLEPQAHHSLLLLHLNYEHRLLLFEL